MKHWKEFIKNLVNALVSKHFKAFIDEHLVENKNQRMASKEIKLSALKEFFDIFNNFKSYSSNKKVLHILIIYIRNGIIPLFIEKITEKNTKGSVKGAKGNNWTVAPKESNTYKRDYCTSRKGEEIWGRHELAHQAENSISDLLNWNFYQTSFSIYPLLMIPAFVEVLRNSISED